MSSSSSSESSASTSSSSLNDRWQHIFILQRIFSYSTRSIHNFVKLGTVNQRFRETIDFYSAPILHLLFTSNMNIDRRARTNDAAGNNASLLFIEEKKRVSLVWKNLPLVFARLGAILRPPPRSDKKKQQQEDEHDNNTIVSPSSLFCIAIEIVRASVFLPSTNMTGNTYNDPDDGVVASSSSSSSNPFKQPPPQQQQQQSSTNNNNDEDDIPPLEKSVFCDLIFSRGAFGQMNGLECCVANDNIEVVEYIFSLMDDNMKKKVRSRKVSLSGSASYPPILFIAVAHNAHNVLRFLVKEQQFNMWELYNRSRIPRIVTDCEPMSLLLYGLLFSKVSPHPPSSATQQRQHQIQSENAAAASDDTNKMNNTHNSPSSPPFRFGSPSSLTSSSSSSVATNNNNNAETIRFSYVTTETFRILFHELGIGVGESSEAAANFLNLRWRGTSVSSSFSITLESCGIVAEQDLFAFSTTLCPQLNAGHHTFMSLCLYLNRRDLLPLIASSGCDVRKLDFTMGTVQKQSSFGRANFDVVWMIPFNKGIFKKKLERIEQQLLYSDGSALEKDISDLAEHVATAKAFFKAFPTFFAPCYAVEITGEKTRWGSGNIKRFAVVSTGCLDPCPVSVRATIFRYLTEAFGLSLDDSEKMTSSVNLELFRLVFRDILVEYGFFPDPRPILEKEEEKLIYPEELFDPKKISSEPFASSSAMTVGEARAKFREVLRLGVAESLLDNVHDF